MFIPSSLKLKRPRNKVHDRGSLALRFASLLSNQKGCATNHEKPTRQTPKPKPRGPSAQAPAARASLPIASPQMSNNNRWQTTTRRPNRRHTAQRKDPAMSPPLSQFHSRPKGPGLYARPHPPSTTLSKTAQRSNSRHARPLT